MPKAVCPRGTRPAAANLTSFARDEHVLFEGNSGTARVSRRTRLPRWNPFREKRRFHLRNPRWKTALSASRSTSLVRSFPIKWRTGGELALGSLNRLMLNQDPLMIPFNAWDINPNYTKMPRAKATRANRINESRRGRALSASRPTGLERVRSCSAWCSKRAATASGLKRGWTGTSGCACSARIFDPADYGDEADFEIQFGAISRATTERNSIESAQFEVCGHKWASVHQNDMGFCPAQRQQIRPSRQERAHEPQPAARAGLPE